MTVQGDEWGPWIEHDGKGVPVTAGTYVCARFDDGSEREGAINAGHVRRPFGWSWVWSDITGTWRIVSYRIRRPRALRDLVKLVETLPVPAQPELVPQ